MRSKLFAVGRGTAIALAMALTIARAGLVDAATIPGWLGKPTVPADNACFDQNGSGFGAVHEICSAVTVKYWDIPLAISTAGTHTVTIQGTAGGNAGGTLATSCTLYGSTQAGTLSSSQGGSISITTSLLTLSVTVPASGTLRLVCGIAQSGEVRSVNYNL